MLMQLKTIDKQTRKAILRLFLSKLLSSSPTPSHSSSPLPFVNIPVSFVQSPSFLFSLLLWELPHLITKEWLCVCIKCFSLNSDFSIKKEKYLSHSQRSRIARIASYDFGITYVSFNSILKSTERKRELRWVFLVDLIL